MKDKLNQLLDYINEFEDKPFKPTHTNIKEKIWQLLNKEKQEQKEQLINFAKQLKKQGTITSNQDEEKLVSKYLKTMGGDA